MKNRRQVVIIIICAILPVIFIRDIIGFISYPPVREIIESIRFPVVPPEQSFFGYSGMFLFILITPFLSLFAYLRGFKNWNKYQCIFFGFLVIFSFLWFVIYWGEVIWIASWIDKP